MKTNERTIHFYDLILDSHTRSSEIPRPACIDLDKLLTRLLQTRPIGHQVVKTDKLIIELADWVYDPTTKCHKLLINRADRDVSDITFKDFENNRRRKAGKTKVEGVEASSHIIIKNVSVNRG